MATDLEILQGKTFNRILRLANLPYVYSPITGISQGAPAVITAVGHGLVDGQRAAVVSVKGMTQINASNNPLRSTDYHKVTYISPNSISFNDTNSTDFSAYVSGGYLQYLTPVALTGATARMTIKDQIAAPNLLICSTAGTSGLTLPTAAGADGTVVWGVAPSGSVRSVTWSNSTAFALNAVIDTHELLRLDTTNGGIVVDATAKTILLTISAISTAAMSWDIGVYDLELVQGATVTLLMSGAVSVVDEVTT